MHGVRSVRATAAILALVAAVAAVVGAAAGPARAQSGSLGGALELVDPEVLRVCADPRNLPFSNEAGEGFENALAEKVAGWTGRKEVSYTFFPQGMGFIRNTLRANRCDVVIGYAQGDELVQNTNAYYRTAYALVVPEASDLADVASLSDARLQGRRLGVVAGTPPATSLAVNGLIGIARPYRLMVDTRNESPVADMFGDLARGEIDGALAWGPMAGYYAERTGTPMRVIPLIHEGDGAPRMIYRITMGVRPSDQEWKRELNGVIREHQDEIDALLASYGVPLLDEKDRPIAAGSQ